MLINGSEQCEVCDRLFEGSDAIVSNEHDDDGCPIFIMHEACFERWPDREEFLSKVFLSAKSAPIRNKYLRVVFSGHRAVVRVFLDFPFLVQIFVLGTRKWADVWLCKWGRFLEGTWIPDGVSHSESSALRLAAAELRSSVPTASAVLRRAMWQKKLSEFPRPSCGERRGRRKRCRSDLVAVDATG